MTFSYMERRIMIVTGDAQFRAALERACTGPEHRIETADCVETAMQIADRRPVCLMVAEASVHDVGDGMRLAKAIHIKNPDTKCFLVVDKDDPVV
jgi:DNA-binding NtrC family response regulator